MHERVDIGQVQWPWVSAFVAVAVVLCVGAYAYCIYETERIRQQRYEDLAGIAHMKIAQIQQWRKERLADAWRSANGLDFTRVLTEWLQDPQDSVRRKELLRTCVLERETQDYSDVIICDRQGRILVSANPDSHPLHPSVKRTIEDCLAKGSAILSDLYRSPGGEAQMDAVAPIPDQAGRPIAVIDMRINAESLLYPLIQSWPTPSQTAETVLVTRDGDEVLILNDHRYRPNSALSLREPLTSTNLSVVQAALGRQGMFKGKDYRGVEVLADLQAIPDSPWFLVAQVDESETLAEARYRGFVTILLAALLVLLAAGLTAYGFRNRQARLYRDLYVSERKQREAEKRFRTILYSIGDAVITTDTKGLVQQMNPVAERLTGWPETEAAGKSLDEVFHIVNEDSHTEVENPVQHVLKEELVGALSNQAQLVARDSTERPITESASPIVDENGATSGAVLVFRDQTEERMTQRALQESEARLRSLFQDNPASLWEEDFSEVKTLVDNLKASGVEDLREYLQAHPEEVWRFGSSVKVLDVNQASLDLYEAQSKSELMEGLGSVLCRESFDGLAAQFVMIAEGQTDFQAEGVTRTLKGNPRMVLLKWNVPVGYEKTYARVLVSILDITDRKRAEVALKESEEKLKAIFETSPAAIFLVDQAGRITFANQRMCDLFSRSCEQLLGTEYLDLIHPTERSFGRVNMASLMSGAVEHVSIERRYLAADGRVFLGHLSGRKLLGPDGVLGGLVGIITDITERAAAEEALRYKTSLLNSLIEALPDVVYFKDLARRHLLVNKAYEDFFGLQAENVVGKTIEEVMSEDKVARSRGTDEEVIETKAPLRAEQLWVDQAGESRIFETRKFPILNEQGKIIAVGGISRDITRRKGQEKELIEARDLAEMANRAKTEFLANMSHELRTPLNAIIGFSEILEDQLFGQLNAAQKTHVGYIVESGHHLLQLVSEILDLSKIESGGMRLEPSEVNISDILANTIAIMRQRASRQDLELELKLDPDVEAMTILADDVKIRQVMLNLLSNAVKFTPERGSILVKAQIMDDELIVSVCDTGLGIDASDKSRIFKAFEQVDSTLSRRHEGTGLGLALARKLVEMHGGRIWVESEGLGKGSTFRFSIPIN